MVVASSGSHKVVGRSTEEKRTMFKKLSKSTMAAMTGLLLMSWPPEATPRTMQQFYLFNDTSPSPGPGPDIIVEGDSEYVNTDKKNKTANIIVRTDFTLESFWQTANYNISEQDGADCFPEGPITIRGGIHLKESKSGDVAKAIFWFKSRYNPNGWDDTGDEVQYKLTLTGDAGWSGPFPPLGDADISMTVTHWDMATEGKGAHRDTSCKGMGNDAGLKLYLGSY